MDILQVDNIEISCSQVQLASSDSGAFCHPQINSWSSINTQMMISGQNVIQSSSTPWNPNNQVSETAASMKIFTSVMLHAWRQRRADVRKLQGVVDRLQRNSISTKNELHVCNTLMRVEQKRCRELQLELKKSTLSINQVKNSCQALNTSVISLKAEKEQLEQELNYYRKEREDLIRASGKSKEDLVNALLEQRSLQHQLSNEQKNTEQVNREKEQLLDEIVKLREMENHFKKREDTYIQELNLKNDALGQMRSMIEKLEQRLGYGSLNDTELCSPRKMTEEPKEHVTTVAAYPKLELQPIKQSLRKLSEWYGNTRVLKKVSFCSSIAVFYLWFVLLPKKSLRNGCPPPKIFISL